MLIKIDEDLPRAAADFLRARGYSAATIAEQQMKGWPDAAIWKAVQAEGRLLITADKGFADIRKYHTDKHPGILLLRPDKDGIAAVVALLANLLAAYRLDMLTGTVTVVTPRGIRVRR